MKMQTRGSRTAVSDPASSARASRRRVLSSSPQADARARAIVARVPQKNGGVELHLECGHKVRRRLTFVDPVKIICVECGRKTA